jgi:hypothetical protein
MGKDKYYPPLSKAEAAAAAKRTEQQARQELRDKKITRREYWQGKH